MSITRPLQVDRGAEGQGLSGEDSVVKTQDSGLSGQDSGVRTQDSVVKTQDSVVKTQESGLSGQDSGVFTQKHGRTRRALRPVKLDKRNKKVQNSL